MAHHLGKKKEIPQYLSGPLAQLVEQWTFNPFVDGSNPSWPTTSCVTQRLKLKHNETHIGWSKNGIDTLKLNPNQFGSA
jgi:hypothetical protein